MIDHYLVLVDGKYRSWTRGKRMHVHLADRAKHTFSVVAVLADGTRAPNPLTTTGAAL